MSDWRARNVSNHGDLSLSLSSRAPSVPSSQIFPESLSDLKQPLKCHWSQFLCSKVEIMDQNTRCASFPKASCNSLEKSRYLLFVDCWLWLNNYWCFLHFLIRKTFHWKLKNFDNYISKSWFFYWNILTFSIKIF